MSKKTTSARQSQLNHRADTLNANRGTAGTNRAYDQMNGNRGKQLNPNRQAIAQLGVRQVSPKRHD